MKIIEQFTKEEINQIIKELKEAGHDIKPNLKGFVLNEEAEKLFKCKVYISETLRKPMLELADWATDNYEFNKQKKTRKKDVSESIDEEYRQIISGILQALSKKLGKLGFTKR